MKWVGLTGGIGTGKSTVAEMIRTLGYVVIDADVLAREVVQPGTKGLADVIRAFGPDLLNSDGTLNRKVLGQKVFGDPARLAQLESLLHPRIRALTEAHRQRLANQGERLAFYDVPLLFEKKMESQFDAVVVVAASTLVQRDRIRRRDGLTDTEIDRRLEAQIDIGIKAKQTPYVIWNDGDLEHLRQQTQQMIHSISPSV